MPTATATSEFPRSLAIRLMSQGCLLGPVHSAIPNAPRSVGCSPMARGTACCSWGAFPACLVLRPDRRCVLSMWPWHWGGLQKDAESGIKSAKYFPSLTKHSPSHRHTPLVPSPATRVHAHQMPAPWGAEQGGSGLRYNRSPWTTSPTGTHQPRLGKAFLPHSLLLPLPFGWHMGTESGMTCQPGISAETLLSCAERADGRVSPHLHQSWFCKGCFS